MRAVIVLVLVACGGTSTTRVIDNRAAPPPKPACTKERIAAIAQHLHARWNSTEPPTVRCIPGLFPTAGFYILTEDRAGILAEDGKTELVPFVPASAQPVVACATVDLDGDGIEEIVETLEQRERASTTQWLEIQRITDGELVRIRGPHTSVDHRDLGRCTGEVRLAGQTIVITVAHAPGISPSDCLAAGTHTFALDKHAIVEIDRTRVSRR